MKQSPLTRVSSWLGPQVKRATTLIAGTSAAQIIPLAIAPILTRLYSPASYGVLATFGSIVAILTSVAAGRYTVAVMLPESEREAVQVTGLALFLAALASVALLILAPVAFWSLAGVKMVHDLGGWLFFIPIAVFLGSMFESLSYFSLRKDKVRQIANANVLKTALGGGSQVLLGFFGIGVPGLLVGLLLGFATGNYRLFRTYAQSLQDSRLHWPEMKAMALRYSNFPKYDLWGNLANTLAYNVITLGVGAIYGYHALGQYALAFRTANLPSALLGVAIGQVYLREAAQRAKSPARAIRAFDRTVGILAGTSVLPMIALVIWAPYLFRAVFGQEWQLAGVYAGAMMPLVWARFVSSAMSSVFHVYGKQRILLGFHIALLAIILVTMTAAVPLGWSLKNLLLVQSLGMAAVYLVLLFFARRVIFRSPRNESPVSELVK